MRSAQFGFNNEVLNWLHQNYGKTKQSDRIFGLIDPQIVIAGFYLELVMNTIFIPHDFFTFVIPNQVFLVVWDEH